MELGNAGSRAKHYALKLSRDKVKILVVGTPAFSRAIRHLFDDQLNFEVTSTMGGLKNLGPRIERLAPKLIVADVKPVGTNIRNAVRHIKRSSPLSKLILIFPCNVLAKAARDCGADACLAPDELVRGLLPAAALLSGSHRSPKRTIS